MCAACPEYVKKINIYFIMKQHTTITGSIAKSLKKKQYEGVSFC